MSHCQDERVHGMVGIDGTDLDAGVFMGQLVGVGIGVGRDDADPEVLELADDVDDLAVADVGTVFLEG